MPAAPFPDRPLVTLRELVFIHAVMIDAFGGSDGIRDVGLLESELARPLASYGDTVLYETPSKRAAALWTALMQNHGFVDGNKRTGTAAMMRWLDREGVRLEVADETLVEAALAIVHGRWDLEAAADWIEARLQPVGA
jgi:death-on-curing protein